MGPRKRPSRPGDATRRGRRRRRSRRGPEPAGLRAPSGNATHAPAPSLTPRRGSLGHGPAPGHPGRAIQLRTRTIQTPWMTQVFSGDDDRPSERSHAGTPRNTRPLLVRTIETPSVSGFFFERPRSDRRRGRAPGLPGRAIAPVTRTIETPEITAGFFEASQPDLWEGLAPGRPGRANTPPLGKDDREARNHGGFFPRRPGGRRGRPRGAAATTRFRRVETETTPGGRDPGPATRDPDERSPRAEAQRAARVAGPEVAASANEIPAKDFSRIASAAAHRSSRTVAVRTTWPWRSG